jgi:hypothetical protein
MSGLALCVLIGVAAMLVCTEARVRGLRCDPAAMFRHVISLLAALVVVLATVACGPAALTQQVEARRLAAELHVAFTKAAEAANRAVMADTDDASAAAVREAQDATQAVERALNELQPILTSLRYSDELRFLDTFKERFADYRRLDDEILPLAVENSNLKAQRLSFGPARQAAEEFRRSLNAAVKAAVPANTCCADALAAKAVGALLEIQVLYAPHIAEAEDAAMTRMEEEMAAAEATVQTTLGELRRLLGPAANAQLSAAIGALDRFQTTHREIIMLSRRNSDVRSLALSLGRKRTVTAIADDQLRALEESLAKHTFTGTR